jgi:hypothetical protein
MGQFMDLLSMQLPVASFENPWELGRKEIPWYFDH